MKVSLDRRSIKIVFSILLPDMVAGYPLFMCHYGHGYKQICHTRNRKEFVLD